MSETALPFHKDTSLTNSEDANSWMTNNNMIVLAGHQSSIATTPNRCSNESGYYTSLGRVAVSNILNELPCYVARDLYLIETATYRIESPFVVDTCVKLKR